MKIAGKLFRKISAVSFHSFKYFDQLSKKAAPVALTKSEANKQRWYAIDGDKTLRVQYELGPEAVVYDVGGYEGNWAAEISARYGCRIFVFEPVSKFVAALHQRFERNPSIHIFPYGLAGADATLQISHLGEGSSVFREENNFSQKATEKETIALRAIDKVMVELGTQRIDLMKINIEGGEYELLECLINCKLIRQVSHLQIQFHDFVPDADARMARIKEQLAHTHKQTYEYLYVWENWSLK